jgi:hypothetical protein
MPIPMLSASRRLRWLLGDLAWAPVFRRPRPVPSVPGWSPGDSHVHSDASDGMVPLERQVAWAAENGHGWIAITDHGDGVERDFDSYLQRCKSAGMASGIAVLPGVELSAIREDDPTRNDGDVVVFGLGPEAAVPPNQTLDGTELLRHAGRSASTAFRVIAHPAAGSKHLRWSRWDHDLIEGVELVTGTARANPSAIARWFELGRAALASHRRWHTGLGGSDAHVPWQTPGLGGLTWVRAAMGATPEKIRQSLLRGRAVVSTHGDFACLNVGNASSGDTVACSDDLEVEVSVRPAHSRTCTSVTIHDENARVVAHRIAPSDGEVLHLSGTEARALIAHFEFCARGRRACGDVWANPLVIDARPNVEGPISPRPRRRRIRRVVRRSERVSS